MRFSFSKYSIDITRRGLRFIDHTSKSFVEFDRWVDRFVISNKTPILENIFDTIASEFSKIDLILSKDVCSRSEDGNVTHEYQRLVDDPNYDVLAIRPNALQTKSELLYTIAFQLHMYGNSLVRIVRGDGDVVLALEPLNVDDYLFGQGFDIGDSVYLKLMDKKTGNICLLDYADTIHLRLNPNDIFSGDCNNRFDLTNFVKLFDENLSVMLNELKNAGTVKGIVEIGGYVSGDFNSTLAKNSDKVSKQQEIIDRIKATKGGIIVLDSGEKWTSLTRPFETRSADEINNLMNYLYVFKGINQSVINGTATEAQMGVFFNKSIMPIIERLMEELNYKFLSKKARLQGVRVEYFKNPFEYMSTKEMIANLYLGAMFFTQNEIRHMAFKLPALDGGDVLINNKNFTKEVGVVKKLIDGGDEADAAEDN